VTISDTASNYNVVITGTCSLTSTSVYVSISVYDPTTGIFSFDAGSTNETVTIYPNPFTTSIHIMINDVSQISNCELRIYNILGKEVINKTVTKQLTTLETSDLPSGIYFYKVIGNDKSIQSGKLISQQ